MASYHGPKARVQRRFGEVLIPRTKYQQILEKRPYPPGDHGKESSTVLVGAATTACS